MASIVEELGISSSLLPACFYLPWSIGRASSVIVAGCMLDRLHPRVVLAIAFALGGASMLLFGWPHGGVLTPSKTIAIASTWGVSLGFGNSAFKVSSHYTLPSSHVHCAAAHAAHSPLLRIKRTACMRAATDVTTAARAESRQRVTCGSRPALSHLPRSQVCPAKFFGRAHIGSIQGALQTSNVAATALGPLIVGFTHELFGQYSTVLLSVAVVNLLNGVIVILCLRTPSKNEGHDATHRSIRPTTSSDGAELSAVAAATIECNASVDQGQANGHQTTGVVEEPSQRTSPPAAHWKDADAVANTETHAAAQR